MEESNGNLKQELIAAKAPQDIGPSSVVWVLPREGWHAKVLESNGELNLNTFSSCIHVNFLCYSYIHHESYDCNYDENSVAMFSTSTFEGLHLMTNYQASSN